MVILGLTHPISWNNAACLLVNGRLVAMVEEERINRIKHAPRMAPKEAMAFCLEQAELTLADVDYIAVGFDSAIRAATANINLREGLSGLNQATHWLREGSRYERELPLEGIDSKKIVFVNHHLSHAASTFLASGFESANILSLDGSGGGESGILGVGQDTEIEILKSVTNRGSWGLMYELITDALGFRRHSGEGKTMGLAAYAKPDPDGLPFVEWDGEIPVINPRKRKKFMTALTPRQSNDPLTEEHKVLAATTQDTLERVGRHMAEWLHKKTGLRRLCLAGGTALNCSMNGKLAQLPFVDEIFIQPAAHDAGTALGAALWVHAQKAGQRPDWHMRHPYWGPAYDNNTILEALQSATGITYHLSEDVCAETADLLVDGNVVGWFQGRMEIGPRALGSRSIIADPSRPEMKDLINKKVKHREPWRPFAPSILDEAMARYVSPPIESPYMILAFETKAEARETLQSATHVDGTCRPQTVYKETNPRYWRMIKQFEMRTGIGAVLNTSFNVNKQPIVNTPAQAIGTFLSCGMDKLAIGDYIVSKI